MAGIITTVAGGLYTVDDMDDMTTAGFSGDGGLATSSQLDSSKGIAVDLAGNLYIADTNNNRIRKVNTSGIINTIAGTGGYGFSGDGEAAINATLRAPSGVLLDLLGNLYIIDTNNHAIRKIDSSGIIRTIAGTGEQGYSGDEGSATAARLYYPQGIIFDSARNLYIADSSNHRIRKIDSSGIINTIAGTGVAGYYGDGISAINAQLNNPIGLALYSGNLYIADTINNLIRKIDASGIIMNIAGATPGYSGDGGLAINAELFSPRGITVDLVGNLYIADSTNDRIRKIDSSGIIRTIAGTGSAGYSGDGELATIAQLNTPFGLFFDSIGNLYIADTNNSVIRKVALSSEGPGAPCFLEGTRILSHVDGKEQYVPVESLTVGSYVKTCLHGYKKITMIGKGPIENPEGNSRVQQRLYKLSKDKYPTLKEDLYITGCHSTLVKDLTEEQKELAIKEGERLFVTDKHYRLMACVDEKAEPWASGGIYTIWHFALEHENEHMNYGVFANGGLLVETCCLFTLKNKSNFTFLN